MPTNAKKVFPRNLTARAACRVSGNPVVTRPEDALANCYPGLELDVRNLDRRFFPGLVFDFVARDDTAAPYTNPTRYGALLSYVDVYGDPDLLFNTQEARSLNDQLNAFDSTGQWYIAWIEQYGKRLTMSWYRPEPTQDDLERRQTVRTALDGLYVWRLIRALETGPVTIALERRDISGIPPLVLHGWRRRFTDPSTGVLNAAYQPGELLQSLCSPWTHDFRDCACHYWASNHPDVVLGEVRPGEPVEPDGCSKDELRSTMKLDWLRFERRRALAGSAQNTIPKNRPFQYDHFQINQDWQKLAVVLQDQEIGAVYTPRLADAAEPFPSPGALASVIREKLAPLEMALAIEYLYASFTVRDADEADRDWPTMADDVVFLRHFLLLTAQSEMLHLRWANELLWELSELLPELSNSKAIPGYEPVLEPALEIPADTPTGSRPRALVPLTPEVIDGFVFVEDPGGFIDSTYCRVIATLRQPKYPPHLVDLAVRVATDGIEHFSRFKDMQKIVKTYRGAPNPYLRAVRLGTFEETREALELYKAIRDDLRCGYATEARGRPLESGKPIAEARTKMLELYKTAEGLARSGIGIPYFEAP